jgi:hypothetical protein
MSPTKNPIAALAAHRRQRRTRREQLALDRPAWRVEYYPTIRLRLA